MPAGLKFPAQRRDVMLNATGMGEVVGRDLGDSQANTATDRGPGTNLNICRLSKMTQSYWIISDRYQTYGSHLGTETTGIPDRLHLQIPELHVVRHRPAFEQEATS